MSLNEIGTVLGGAIVLLSIASYFWLHLRINRRKGRPFTLYRKAPSLTLAMIDVGVFATAFGGFAVMALLGGYWELLGFFQPVFIVGGITVFVVVIAALVCHLSTGHVQEEPMSDKCDDRNH